MKRLLVEVCGIILLAVAMALVYLPLGLIVIAVWLLLAATFYMRPVESEPVEEPDDGA